MFFPRVVHLSLYSVSIESAQHLSNGFAFLQPAIMTVAKFTWRVKAGFLLVGLSFVFNLIGFVSPYWLVSWSRIHTPFDHVGLWEFCLKGYVARSDPSMRSYFGCWWIFAPEFSPIQHILMPRKLLERNSQQTYPEVDFRLFRF